MVFRATVHSSFPIHCILILSLDVHHIYMHYICLYVCICIYEYVCIYVYILYTILIHT